MEPHSDLFLCGGGVIFLGSLLSWGISVLLFMPMEMATEKGAISTVSIWQKLVLFFWLEVYGFNLHIKMEIY